MVKKLRYYARFIVVSLLLNKVDLVKELIQELHHYAEEYVSVYEAEDDEEWRLVISEVTAFMEVSYTKACGPFLERCAYLASNRSRFSKHQTTGSPVFSINLTNRKDPSNLNYPETLYRSQV